MTAEKRRLGDPIVWSSTGDDVCVCGVGARTPLGVGADASCVAVNAAISSISAHPFFVDKNGEPICLSRDAEYDAEMPVRERVAHMLQSAITEAVADASIDAGDVTDCWIGLPDTSAAMDLGVAKGATSAVIGLLGFDRVAMHVVEHGHASGLLALQAAARRISTGEAEVCLVAGVDSYHDPDILERLDRQGQLMSSQNRNGFPPGEGAGAVLLARRSLAIRRRLPIFARIGSASTATEPHPIRSSRVSVGDGLSVAIKGALTASGWRGERVTDTYCDLNGERYRSEELTYTLLRVQRFFVKPHDYLCPADCWGDVGAASGPLFASLAIVAGRRRIRSKGLFPLLWASSESGYRTAITLELTI